MTTVNINDALYNEIEAFLKGHEVEYPTIKNFCERAIKGLLSIEKSAERLKDKKYKEGDLNEDRGNDSVC